MLQWNNSVWMWENVKKTVSIRVAWLNWVLTFQDDFSEAFRVTFFVPWHPEVLEEETESGPTPLEKGKAGHCLTGLNWSKLLLIVNESELELPFKINRNCKSSWNFVDSFLSDFSEFWKAVGCGLLMLLVQTLERRWLYWPSELQS